MLRYFIVRTQVSKKKSKDLTVPDLITIQQYGPDPKLVPFAPRYEYRIKSRGRDSSGQEWASDGKLRI